MDFEQLRQKRNKELLRKSYQVENPSRMKLQPLRKSTKEKLLQSTNSQFYFGFS